MRKNLLITTSMNIKVRTSKRSGQAATYKLIIIGRSQNFNGD